MNLSQGAKELSCSAVQFIQCTFALFGAVVLSSDLLSSFAVFILIIGRRQSKETAYWFELHQLFTFTKMPTTTKTEFLANAYCVYGWANGSILCI